MKLPSFKRIYSEDYTKFGEEIVKLVNQLTVNINNSLELLYLVLNKRVNLRDNIAATVKDITVRVDTSGIPTTTTSIVLDLNTKVDALIVGKVNNLANSNLGPVGGVTLTWEQNQTNVFISNITGLQPNVTYQIRVVAFQQ